MITRVTEIQVTFSSSYMTTNQFQFQNEPEISRTPKEGKKHKLCGEKKKNFSGH